MTGTATRGNPLQKKTLLSIKICCQILERYRLKPEVRVLHSSIFTGMINTQIAADVPAITPDGKTTKQNSIHVDD